MKTRRIAGIALLYVAFLYISWIGAWLLERWLERIADLPAAGLANVAYWTFMKLLLWVAPSLMIIRMTGRKLSEAFGVRCIGRAALWGIGAGLALGLLSAAAHWLMRRPMFSGGSVWALLSGVVISPGVEEISFRGAVLGALQTRFRFAVANLMTAALFLGAHLPGWYFQGVLVSNLLNPLGGALSILALGFVFGCVAKKSDSLAGSIFTHILNNLFSL